MAKDATSKASRERGICVSGPHNRRRRWATEVVGNVAAAVGHVARTGCSWTVRFT